MPYMSLHIAKMFKYFHWLIIRNYKIFDIWNRLQSWTIPLSHHAGPRSMLGITTLKTTCFSLKFRNTTKAFFDSVFIHEKEAHYSFCTLWLHFTLLTKLVFIFHVIMYNSLEYTSGIPDFLRINILPGLVNSSIIYFCYSL